MQEADHDIVPSSANGKLKIRRLRDKLGRNPKSGFKGVYKKDNKWSAYIQANGDTVRLGVFSSPELAHEAVVAAEQQYDVSPLVAPRIITFAEVIAGVRLIPLTRGIFTLVDDSDYESLIPFIWSFDGYYAFRHVRNECGTYRSCRMHRLLMGEPKGLSIDHINCNKLDNRRSNLRVAARAQNMQNMGKQRRNTTGYKGVVMHKKSGRYKAQLCAFGVRMHLGYFDTPEEAHLAYCAAAEQHHGEFAHV